MSRPAPAPDPGRAHRAALPGLPAERTRLAWDRTALGLLAHGGLALAHEPAEAGPMRVTLVAASLTLAILAIVLGRLRAHEVAARRHTDSIGHAGPAVLTMATGLILLGLLDLVAIAAA